MTRILAALVVLLLAPAAAQARSGDPDRAFGRRGTVTLKATAADAVGGAVKVLSDGRVLSGGAAAGQFVVVKLRSTGTLDRRFGTNGQVVPALPGTTLDGVRALATFRDGRIVAAGTLRLADGTTRMTVLRLLPTGEIDPSFGGGDGYVLAGPVNAQLTSMTMERSGNVILAGSRPGPVPILIRLLGDGTPDPAFGSNSVFDGATLGLGGTATSVMARADGTTTFTAGGGSTANYPAVFSTVRLLATGQPDPSFGGIGLVNITLGPGVGVGIGAAAVRSGPGGRTVVAGTDLTERGTPRAAIIRLGVDGALDTRFGSRGIAHLARAGMEIRIKAMVRDRLGRILLAGSGAPPDSLVMRLRANGRRDRSFGNGGLTLPVLGRPPGGSPIYATFDAIDAHGTRPVIAGSAAGPGELIRSAGGTTTYTGRFAFTVSRLQ